VHIQERTLCRPFSVVQKKTEPDENKDIIAKIAADAFADAIRTSSASSDNNSPSGLPNNNQDATKF
jgi:hypothetical protein